MQSLVLALLGFASLARANDIPLNSYEKTIRTHAILMSLGFLVFIPIGILVARYSRTIPALKGRWFNAHWFIQLVISGPLIFAGWAKGYNFVNAQGLPHFADHHRKVGLAIIILYLAQLVWGVIIHFWKPASSSRPLPPASAEKSSAANQILPAIKGRPIQNYGHALNGLTILALAFYNVHYGYDTEWPFGFGTDRSNTAFLRHLNAWWISWVVIIPILYILGLLLLPRQWKQETAARRKEVIDMEPRA